MAVSLTPGRFWRDPAPTASTCCPPLLHEPHTVRGNFTLVKNEGAVAQPSVTPHLARQGGPGLLLWTPPVSALSLTAIQRESKSI